MSRSTVRVVFITACLSMTACVAPPTDSSKDAVMTSQDLERWQLPDSRVEILAYVYRQVFLDCEVGGGGVFGFNGSEWSFFFLSRKGKTFDDWPDRERRLKKAFAFAGSPWEFAPSGTTWRSHSDDDDQSATFVRPSIAIEKTQTVDRSIYITYTINKKRTSIGVCVVRLRLFKSDGGEAWKRLDRERSEKAR